MSAAVTLRVDGAALVEQRLAALARRFADLTPLMDAFGLTLEEATIDRFDRERAPDGSGWTPSIRAREEGGKTLTDSARLRQSIGYRASAARVEVGTNVIYAAIHQFGGRISAKSDRGLTFRLPGGLGFRRKPFVDMPARPFLGVSAEDEAELIALAEDFARDAAPEIES